MGRHRPTMIPLTVEYLPDGRLRVETPLTRGWSSVVRSPHELARAVEAAFIEVTIAGYARSRNAKYDLSKLTEQVDGDSRTALTAAAGTPPTHRPVRAAGRPPRHNPASWAKLPDGRWQAPGGRKYHPDSQVVRNVLRLREERGLPT
jgi:hypothetical protein